jgi:hypothetical protein
MSVLRLSKNICKCMRDAYIYNIFILVHESLIVALQQLNLEYKHFEDVFIPFALQKV